MRTLWPKGANMRSREVVLAVLVKGHRTDPVQVWAYQTLTMLRTMLRGKRNVELWQQAWKAMQKRRIRLGTEGLAANATRVLRRLGWSWESSVEVKTREGEKIHVTQCPEGYWNHKIREAVREWRLRQAKAGGYFCEDRLQVWTDRSCLDPRWEAIARAGAGIFFSKDSELNAHFSIKARTQGKRQ